MTRATRSTRDTRTSRRRGFGWRRWLLLAAIALGCVSTTWAALRIRDYVTTDPAFHLARGRRDALRIEGIRYTPRARVAGVFARDFDRSIFDIPLAERYRRLLAIEWVEDASVSRIWPDRLAVRIRERQPVAFVNLRLGVQLIDRHGVLLEPPPQTPFSFVVLRGVDEAQSDAERSTRVAALLRLQEELGPLNQHVSEVDAADPDNLRLVVQVPHGAVEVLLGDGDPRPRLQDFLDHYAEIHKRSPEKRIFDVRQTGHILAQE